MSAGVMVPCCAGNTDVNRANAAVSATANRRRVVMAVPPVCVGAMLTLSQDHGGRTSVDVENAPFEDPSHGLERLDAARLVVGDQPAAARSGGPFLIPNRTDPRQQVDASS